MGFFSNKNGNAGIMDVIRCDEPSYLIWKWHPEGSKVNGSSRENAIRWGSSLRVKDGEVAVFVYRQQSGLCQDYIHGPFDAFLETDNLPVLASITGLAWGDRSPIQAEVYFINLAKIIQLKFGVPFFSVFDPEYPEFAVPVAVRGTITFKISDYMEFIKLHRLINFTMKDFEKSIRDAIAREVKATVLETANNGDYPVIQIENQIDKINDAIEAGLTEELNKDFGIDVTRIDVSAIEIKKDSDGYRDLMAITKDLKMRTLKAQADANIVDYAENLRIQREEGQYALHKQSQSSNMAAFQVESQTTIGTASAEALGKMGGSGSVNVGSSAQSGFNPAAMMAGVAMGSAVGQNLAGVMNGAMQPVASPPPIKQVQYHVAINGQAAGPYVIDTLKQMVSNKQITLDTLVWTVGMADWAKASTIDEIKTLFTSYSIPPIPNNPSNKGE